MVSESPILSLSTWTTGALAAVSWRTLGPNKQGSTINPKRPLQILAEVCVRKAPTAYTLLKEGRLFNLESARGVGSNLSKLPMSFIINNK